jgi:acetolactate synthase-1/2/3 large subunit
MVEFQEEAKYGRSSGIKLGGIDFVKYAEAFEGAKGFRINSNEELEKVMKEALSFQGVAIVDVRIDYSRSADLMKDIIPKDYR